MKDMDLLFMAYLDRALEMFEEPEKRGTLERLDVYRTAFREIVAGALCAEVQQCLAGSGCLCETCRCKPCLYEKVFSRGRFAAGDDDPVSTEPERVVELICPDHRPGSACAKEKPPLAACGAAPCRAKWFAAGQDDREPVPEEAPRKGTV